MLTPRQRGYNLAVRKRAELDPSPEVMQEAMDELTDFAIANVMRLSDADTEAIAGATEANGDMLRVMK